MAQIIDISQPLFDCEVYPGDTAPSFKRVKTAAFEKTRLKRAIKWREMIQAGIIPRVIPPVFAPGTPARRGRGNEIHELLWRL
jgi:hypothetical protein